MTVLDFINLCRVLIQRYNLSDNFAKRLKQDLYPPINNHEPSIQWGST